MGRNTSTLHSGTVKFNNEKVPFIIGVHPDLEREDRNIVTLALSVGTQGIGLTELQDMMTDAIEEVSADGVDLL